MYGIALAFIKPYTICKSFTWKKAIAAVVTDTHPLDTKIFYSCCDNYNYCYCKCLLCMHDNTIVACMCCCCCMHIMAAVDA